MKSITIFIPENSDDYVSEALRELTEACYKAGAHISGGLLGGEFGYGADYENDIFMMHHFCWCDDDDCPWCGDENRANFIYKPTGAVVYWYKYIGRGMRIYGELPKGWLSICIQSIVQENKLER